MLASCFDAQNSARRVRAMLHACMRACMCTAFVHCCLPCHSQLPAPRCRVAAQVLGPLGADVSASIHLEPGQHPGSAAMLEAMAGSTCMQAPRLQPLAVPAAVQARQQPGGLLSTLASLNCVPTHVVPAFLPLCRRQLPQPHPQP